MRLCHRTVSHGKGKAKTVGVISSNLNTQVADLRNLFPSMDLSSPYFAAIKCAW